jgi:methyl-accepting chemotaxis protein
VHQKSIVTQGYLTRLIIGVFVIFSSGVITASLLLYYKTDKSLHLHYGAIISTLITLKEGLFSLSLKISLLVSFLTMIGLLIIGVLYTHRIAGPIHRLRKKAKAIAQGEISEKITFRRKDAIHSVGDSFNYMIESIKSDISEIKREIKEVEDFLNKLDDKSINKAELLNSLDKAETNIKSIINKYEI